MWLRAGQAVDKVLERRRNPRDKRGLGETEKAHWETSLLACICFSQEKLKLWALVAHLCARRDPPVCVLALPNGAAASRPL